MWRNKWIVCLICCVLLLTACNARPVTEDPAPTFPTAPEAIYKTTTVTSGTFVVSDRCPATYVFPLNEVLTCEYNGAILEKSIKHRMGDKIAAGEVIATFHFDVSNAELERLDLSYREAVRVMNEQLASYQQSISDLSAAVSQPGTAGQIAALQLEQVRNEYELYRKSSSADVENKKKALTDYQDLFTPKTLVAPEDCIVADNIYIESGTVLWDGSQILHYYKSDVKYLKAGGMSAEMMKVMTPGTRVEISDGSGSVEGYVISTPTGVDDLSGVSDVYFSSDYLDSLSLRSSYSITCKILELENMLLLKKEAIHTEGNINYVYVLDQGVRLRRNVQVGMESDGIVCILSGLTEGQQVVIN